MEPIKAHHYDANTSVIAALSINQALPKLRSKALVSMRKMGKRKDYKSGMPGDDPSPKRSPFMTFEIRHRR